MLSPGGPRPDDQQVRLTGPIYPGQHGRNRSLCVSFQTHLVHPFFSVGAIHRRVKLRSLGREICVIHAVPYGDAEHSSLRLRPC